MPEKFNFNPDYLSGRSTHAGSWAGGSSETVTELGPPDTSLVAPQFDTSVPDAVPAYRTNWVYSWRIHVNKKRQVLSLNKLDLIKKAVSSLTRSRKLYNTEIHIMWFSNIPQNLFRENVTFSLHFSESTDPDKKVMSKNIFPGYLNTHHIFYPGHSIELHNSPIPWEIHLDNTAIQVTEKYVMGEIHVKLVGMQGDIAKMEEEKTSQVIAMVPLTQPIAGVTLTRPRIPGTEWLQGYVKRGVNSKAKVDKMIKLQSLGIDIEGAVLAGKINSVLGNVPDQLLEQAGNHEIRREIYRKVIDALGKNGKGGKKKRGI
uniref:Protein 3 n=1 Tax=Sciadopitys virus 1_Can TaxID=2977986 RepID=A0A9N6YJE4_9RHAB|nr:TPA_asm: protein 3 [Sciadopitys virus 1_Can]